MKGVETCFMNSCMVSMTTPANALFHLHFTQQIEKLLTTKTYLWTKPSAFLAEVPQDGSPGNKSRMKRWCSRVCSSKSLKSASARQCFQTWDGSTKYFWKHGYCEDSRLGSNIRGLATRVLGMATRGLGLTIRVGFDR